VSAWTGIEIREERDKLEREVAALLGFMLFEYARLDMALGMALTWADGGRDLESRSEQFAGANLYSKLAAFDKAAQAKFERNPQTKEAFLVLIDDAHRAREFRNILVHGRWGFEATEQTAVCVTALPTSVGQREIRYTISDLEGMLESVRSIRQRLHKLVADKWP